MLTKIQLINQISAIIQVKYIRNEVKSIEHVATYMTMIKLSRYKGCVILFILIHITARNQNKLEHLTSRILNVDSESEEDYPWLAGVILVTESKVPGETLEGYCTGALITKRY